MVRPARPVGVLPWDEWRATVTEEEARQTWEHIARSPNCSIDKARRLIGYELRYSSLQAVQEAVTWLIEQGQVKVPGESMVHSQTYGGGACPARPEDNRHLSSDNR